METSNTQELESASIPTPKQFRTKFQEIFEAETNFGSSRAARLELLESVMDIIKEYLNHDCSIVYLHGKLKEAGYTGARKELSEWLVEKGLWMRREVSEKKAEAEKNVDTENSQNVSSNTENTENNTESAMPPASTNDNKNDMPSPPQVDPAPTSKAHAVKIVTQPIGINKTKAKEKRDGFRRFMKYLATTENLSPQMHVEDFGRREARLYLAFQKDKRGPNCSNKDRKVLTTAWRWGVAYLDGFPLDKPDPFLGCQRYPEIRTPRYIPPEEDFWKIYNVAPPREQALLTCYLNLAARKSELLRLTWDEVDFCRNTVF